MEENWTSSSIAKLHLAIADADADIDIEAAAAPECSGAPSRLEARRQDRAGLEAQLDRMQDAIDAGLVAAAKSGDVGAARRCLDGGADMDRPTSHPLNQYDLDRFQPGLVAPSIGNEGWTAFMYANFDFILDHLSPISQLFTTLHAAWAMLYFVPC